MRPIATVARYEISPSAKHSSRLVRRELREDAIRSLVRTMRAKGRGGCLPAK